MGSTSPSSAHRPRASTRRPRASRTSAITRSCPRPPRRWPRWPTTSAGSSPCTGSRSPAGSPSRAPAARPRAPPGPGPRSSGSAATATRASPPARAPPSTPSCPSSRAGGDGHAGDVVGHSPERRAVRLPRRLRHPGLRERCAAGPRRSTTGGRAHHRSGVERGHWRRARRVLTGPDGAFSTDLKPARRMYVRVRYGGVRSGLRRSTSPRLLPQLRPLITLKEPPSLGVRREPGGAEGNGGTTQATAHPGGAEARERPLPQGACPHGTGRRRGRFATSFRRAEPACTATTSSPGPDLDTDRGASARQVLRVGRG